MRKLSRSICSLVSWPFSRAGPGIGRGFLAQAG